MEFVDNTTYQSLENIVFPSLKSDDHNLPSNNYDENTGKDEPEKQIFYHKDEDFDFTDGQIEKILDDEDNENVLNDEDIENMLNDENNDDDSEVHKIVLKDVIIILNPTDFVVKKKRAYSEAHRLAQNRYREKYPEKYKELQQKIYNRSKLNDEWREKFNKKCCEIQKKIRDKKREERIANGEDVRGRGRPKKDLTKKNVDVNIVL